MPNIPQVAADSREKLHVFGDYDPTSDGSGVRDYIHVMDLAEGHVAALRYSQDNNGLMTVNLGTGQGISVSKLVAPFERVSSRSAPFTLLAVWLEIRRCAELIRLSPNEC